MIDKRTKVGMLCNGTVYMQWEEKTEVFTGLDELVLCTGYTYTLPIHEFETLEDFDKHVKEITPLATLQEIRDNLGTEFLRLEKVHEFTEDNADFSGGGTTQNTIDDIEKSLGLIQEAITLLNLNITEE